MQKSTAKKLPNKNNVLSFTVPARDLTWKEIQDTADQLMECLDHNNESIAGVARFLDTILIVGAVGYPALEDFVRGMQKQLFTATPEFSDAFEMFRKA
jgi:hypothetical protein